MCESPVAPRIAFGLGILEKIRNKILGRKIVLETRCLEVFWEAQCCISVSTFLYIISPWRVRMKMVHPVCCCSRGSLALVVSFINTNVVHFLPQILMGKTSQSHWLQRAWPPGEKAWEPISKSAALRTFFFEAPRGWQPLDYFVSFLFSPAKWITSVILVSFEIFLLLDCFESGH